MTFAKNCVEINKRNNRVNAYHSFGLVFGEVM
jgi:hypothetical protein